MKGKKLIGFRKRERERTIRRILVVEDEPLVAFENEHLLEDAGYEVVATVDNLEAAREVIESEPLDLVMTDFILRGDGDGRDVARAAAARGVPVLMVTARIEMAEEAGVLGCLAKPYSDRTFQAALIALDDTLQGRKTKKLPAGVKLFKREPA